MERAEVKRRPRHTGVQSGSEPIFSRLFKQNCGESEHSLFSNTPQCSNNRKVVEARLSFVCTRYAGAQEGGTTSDAKRNLEWMRQVRKRVKYLIRHSYAKHHCLPHFPKGKAYGARQSPAIQWSPAPINTRLAVWEGREIL